MKTAIIVMGGGLVKKGGRWKTIDLGEGSDNFAPSNDRWRVDAAFELWKIKPDSFILASGGKGQLKDIPGAPNISSVIKSELIELGVPETVIIEESGSNDTFQQLREISALALERSFDDLKVLSNEWHLPRIKAMLEFAPGLKEAFSHFKVSTISAEDILLKSDPEIWREKIFEARRSPEIKERENLEKQGVNQIHDGTYKYNV